MIRKPLFAGIYSISRVIPSDQLRLRLLGSTFSLTRFEYNWLVLYSVLFFSLKHFFFCFGGGRGGGFSAFFTRWTTFSLGQVNLADVSIFQPDILYSLLLKGEARNRSTSVLFYFICCCCCHLRIFFRHRQRKNESEQSIPVEIELNGREISI